MALELTNPYSPAKVRKSAWIGVKDICRRAGFDDATTLKICQDLQLQRREALSWSAGAEYRCNQSLLRFYHDRLTSAIKADIQPPHHCANLFACVVFSIHISSSVIETYFSKTNYIKSKHRSSMHDTMASATLHLPQQCPRHHHVEQLQRRTERSMMVDVDTARTFCADSKKELEDKQICRGIGREDV